MLIRSSIVILLIGGISVGKCEKSKWSSSVRLLVQLYEDCQKKGFVPCLKMKAITFFDRVARSREIPLDDNIFIVRDAGAVVGDTISTEKALEGSLPRGSEEARNARLNHILFEKIATFFNSHKIVFNLPKIKANEIEEEVEEGRGKMKKMMSMMMMGLAMKKAAAFPMMIGVLFLLAGKALVISKLALVLTLLISLKKLKSSSK